MKKHLSFWTCLFVAAVLCSGCLVAESKYLTKVAIMISPFGRLLNTQQQNQEENRHGLSLSIEHFS